jgi:hypothetical protein
MEREFGALKGLMGVNGLSGVDIMPELGIGTKDKGSCSGILIVGSQGGCVNCGHSCEEGCMAGCKAGKQNG